MKKLLLRGSLLGGLAPAARAEPPIQAPGQAPAEILAERKDDITLGRPGKGIGPFQLGQRVEDLERTGLRHGPLDAAGWTSVAEPGSDVVAYRLRFAQGALATIDYRMSRIAAGLRVGGALFRRDQPGLYKALHGALKCDPIEHMEGGNRAACPSPRGDGVTSLRGGLELDCSPWVLLGPSRPCASNEPQKEFTEVRVSRD